MFSRALSVIIPAPLILYYLWVFHAHYVFSWWSEQSITSHLSLVTMGLSLGFAFVLLAVSIHTIGNFDIKNSTQIYNTSFLARVLFLFSVILK
ncbi:MAG: hypothetical protein GF384_01070 [Elusimicrobia bacterium]|nr:hypothetical protein [Elusimicrobiota bacterium]